MRKSVPVLAVLLALIVSACQSSPPTAQVPATDVPFTIRGKVQNLNGQVLTVATREGMTATVTLTARTEYRKIIAKRFSDIKVGDFIATTTVIGKDGQPHAAEIHLLPIGSHIPKGQRAASLRPNSTMTNAVVGSIAKAPDGAHVLVLNFGDKSFTLIVDRNTPVVAYGPTEMKLLVKGRQVMIGALKKPDGAVIARNVSIEYHDVKPPM